MQRLELFIDFGGTHGECHRADIRFCGQRRREHLLSKSDESYKPDMTASMADTSALACAVTLTTGRFNSLAGKGAA